jgi:serine/threonine protein kinase
MPQDIEQIIPDYELLAKVGAGGYGEVYLAKSLTGQYRAVKIIYRNRLGSTEAFDREFRGAQFYETVSRKNEGLVDILHVGRNDERGFFYYVMDAADDERHGRTFDPATYRPRTLRSELTTRIALPIEECIAIGTQLASALMFLQENGLVHRDVKPSNIIFIDGVLKLADIGLVADIREAKSVVGTPGYEPPEHHGSFSGDVYSLGKLLYEISTGRDSRNFGEAPSDEADTDDPRFARLNAIVLKACANHFKDRYQSAKAFHKALLELGPPGTAPTGKSPGRQAARLHRALWYAAGTLVVIGTVIWAFYFIRNRTGESEFKAHLRAAEVSGKADGKALIKSLDGDLKELHEGLEQIQDGGVAKNHQPTDTTKSNGKPSVSPAEQAQSPGATQIMPARRNPELVPPPVTNENNDLAEYARKSLSTITLTPGVTLSRNLMQAGATARIAGKDYLPLYQCWSNRQWLALLTLALNHTGTNWPERSQIDGAISAIKDKDWSVVLTAPAITNAEIAGLSFSPDQPSRFIQIWAEWPRHADKVSWVHRWAPKTSHIAIMTGDRYLLYRKATLYMKEYEKKLADLEQLEDLGDIKTEEYQARISALQQETRKVLCKWVEEDTEAEVAILQELARRELIHDADILTEKEIRLMESYDLDVWLAKEKRRKLGVGAEKDWIASWQKYRNEDPGTDVNDLFGITAENVSIEDELPPMNPEQSIEGSWKLIRTDGVDSEKKDYAPIFAFDNMGGVRMTFQGDVEGKRINISTDGTYNLAHATLFMELNAPKDKGQFVLWFEGPNLILQQFDSRWTLAPVKSTVHN